MPPFRIHQELSRSAAEGRQTACPDSMFCIGGRGPGLAYDTVNGASCGKKGGSRDDRAKRGRRRRCGDAAWRDRAEAIVEQLRDYRWSAQRRLAAASRHRSARSHPAEASARLFERGRVAATPMAGGDPVGQRYLRLMFAAAF